MRHLPDSLKNVSHFQHVREFLKYSYNIEFFRLIPIWEAVTKLAQDLPVPTLRVSAFAGVPRRLQWLVNHINKARREVRIICKDRCLNNGQMALKARFMLF